MMEKQVIGSIESELEEIEKMDEPNDKTEGMYSLGGSWNSVFCC
ncbi:hypothetical protein ACTNDS_00335 [Blautia sp. HCP3S3_C12]